MSDDPMADFLAREKAALGDDADLFASGASPSTAKGASDFPDFDAPQPAKSPAPPSQPAQSAPSGMDAFPDISGASPTAPNVRVTGVAGTGEDAEMEQFESAFPDLSGELGHEQATAKPVFNALSPQPYGASPYPQRGPSPSPTSPSASASASAGGVLPAPAFGNTLPASSEDSEPIKAWRARQAEEIKARDERDRAARDAVRDKAEKSVDAFYEGYNKVKEKNIRENKENEAAFLEKLNEGIAKGSSWERVTELIGLENSQSKTIRPSVPGGSDLARMKEILLALRREGDKAPGAAGF